MEAQLEYQGQIEGVNDWSLPLTKENLRRFNDEQRDSSTSNSSSQRETESSSQQLSESELIEMEKEGVENETSVPLNEAKDKIGILVLIILFVYIRRDFAQ